jgi:hypothetical protein
MEHRWTTEQVQAVLTATLQRLKINPKSFKIEIGKFNAREVTLSNFNGSKSIYISLDSERVYISLDGIASFWTPSFLFFEDRLIKKTMKELHYICRHPANHQDDAGKTLVKCFPEIIDQQFEEQVLERQYGEKK